MVKGKKFTAAEKHFYNIIVSKDKTIKRLEQKYDEIFKEKYGLMIENENLRSELEYTKRALNELNKLNNLSPGEIKTLVDKAMNVNLAVNLITGKVTEELLGQNSAARRY